MTSRRLRIVAVGDIHPNRENPKETFSLVEEVMASGDLRCAQLECTLSSRGVLRTDVRNPAHRVPPKNLEALTAAGFDIISFATNNALDHGTEPFMDTIERLHRAGISVVGAGGNLGDARKPVILERNGVRIAFVSACSILRDGYAATPKRPGIAPLHIRTFYEPLENIYEQPGTPARTWTLADTDDLESVLDTIGTAKAEADILVACFHWGVHFTHDLAMYQADVGYAAIDAGADLVLGTHPHCLQAFDVYKGRIIAYSLGNFVFEQDPVVSHEGVNEYLSFYGIPIDLETPRVPHPKHTKLTGLLLCDIEDRQIARVAFRPAVIGEDARPLIAQPDEPVYSNIVDLITGLSAELGTRLTPENGELVIQRTKERPIDARRLLRRRKMSYPSLRRLSTHIE